VAVIVGWSRAEGSSVKAARVRGRDRVRPGRPPASRGARPGIGILGLALILALGCKDYSGGAGGGTSQAAQAPTAQEAVEIEAFGATVHPLLRERCAACHSGGGPGHPNLAHADSEEAWWTVSSWALVSPEVPTESRLVQRLVGDQHHCWSNCMDDGLQMLSTILTWQATMAVEQQVVEEPPPAAALRVEPPAAIAREATAPSTPVSLNPPVAVGGVAPLSIEHDAPAAGFPIGNTLVRWLVRDAVGAEVSVTQSVSVTDTTPPILSAPPAIITNATGALTPVNLGIASANDLVSGAVAVQENGPARFPVGTTTVVWTAMDEFANTATATQQVTVNPVTSTALAVMAPGPIGREASGPRTVVDLGMATASGGQAPLAVRHDAPSGGFPVGDHVVRWTVRDAANQTSVATQQVRISDTTPPTIAPPPDVVATAEGDRTPVVLGVATASDLVDANVSLSSDAPAAGFELGASIVTWTARDASGNTATATQQVRVDPAELTLEPPPAVTAEATGPETIPAIGRASASGGAPPLSIENDAPAGGFAIGQHVVTWTVRDQQGQTRSATQSVVIRDTTPPLLTAPPDRTVEAESAPVTVDLGEPQAADLSGSAVEISHDAPAGGFPRGTTEVRWTAADASGNRATAVQRITVAAPGPVSGDAATGSQVYAANCSSCHGTDIAANVLGIQAGAVPSAIDAAIRSVPAMQGFAFLLDEPQTLADLAAFIDGQASPAPPVADACRIDEDPMQPAPLQRLSKLQYTNTLRDLLRRQLDRATADAIFADLTDELARIPADQSSNSFRSLDQRISADHIEGFFNVALGFADAIVESDSRLVDFVGEACAANPGDTGCRERFVERFGAVVLRHPLNAEEIAFYASAPDYHELIATLLMAPGFLSIEQYRGSEDPADFRRTVLSPYELASKLSYHFWQTMPDTTLLASAASGELESNYEAVVERVFNDPRTRAAMPEFFGGWLRVGEIPEFDRSKPERESFLTSDYGNGTALPADLDLEAYRQAAIDEVLAFADHTTFVRDGRLEDLFTSRDSFASDPMLAQAYGVAPWPGGSSPPVPFAASQRRSGVLSRAALQMYGDFRSHPILKGARVRMELLCDELSTPADVETPEEAIIYPNFSTRELTEAITEIQGTPCAGCHEPFINPLGFPTESFDALGRERADEILFDEAGAERFRTPVDTRTVPRIDLNSNATVVDAVELGELVANSPKTSACFVRHYYRFSQRRMEVDSTDRCELDALEGALESSGLQGMLKAVALLPEFKLRALPD
jgi:mono/diheme cytochrome c family protein